MYRLSGEAFEERFLVMTTNLRRMILEDVVRAPFHEVNEHLEVLGRTLVIGQIEIGAEAQLSPDQAADFESRLDDIVAEAIVTIQGCLDEYPNRQSVEFQFEAATRLGIPIA